ncbi:MAG: hypothetical protein QE263_06170 [Vampirovibrionales bacterium]|nr:hypothetical protein [Vampirovibrionales bacterium]
MKRAGLIASILTFPFLALNGTTQNPLNPPKPIEAITPEQKPVTTYDYNKSLIPQTSPALQKDTVTLSTDSTLLHSQDTTFKEAFPFFEKIAKLKGGPEIIGAFNKIETPKGTVKITSQNLGYPQLFIHYGKTGIFDRFDMNRDSSVTLTRMTPLGDPFKSTNASTPYQVLTFSYAGKPGSVEQTNDSFEEGSQIDVEESNPQPVPVNVRNFMPKRK